MARPRLLRLAGLLLLLLWCGYNVSGTVTKPEITGSLKLLLAEFRMVNRQIPTVHDGTFEIRADGREISIESFEAQVSGGKVALTGGVSFPQANPADEALRPTDSTDIAQVCIAGQQVLLHDAIVPAVDTDAAEHPVGIDPA